MLKCLQLSPEGTSAMSSTIFNLLHFFLILDSIWAKLAPEDTGAAVRKGAHVEPGTEQRVFAQENANRDMISFNMFKVYEKYREDPQSQEDGNTVRSFKAEPRISHSKEVFQFNLSTIPESELILSASFHFLYQRQRHYQRSMRLRRPRHPSVQFSSVPQLFFQGTNSPFVKLGNITLAPFKKGSWQSRDVTAIVKHAREIKELLITLEFDAEFGASQTRLTSENLPYILVYADDQAIGEPNSVALSLQRYGPFPEGGDISTSTSASRIRRELKVQSQTNNIPEVQFNTLKNHELWQNTYFPAKSKAGVKPAKKQIKENSEGLNTPQVLSFDERTMKKARRRQWSEPRVCSRRYLRVDFADIGWSEWVLAPKSFDAYYCAGTCGFPIPKVARPSNHATIQSIVRAVGIVPGVPEPCCVPEKMSPLSVLFLDLSRNMVLKVYPGMSVDTCACR